MKISSSFRALLPRTLAASVVALAAWSHSAVAQQVAFSAGGFDNATTYPVNTSLTGDENWTSNDAYTGASYNPGSGARDIGSSDDVFNSGYAASTADNQAYLGGQLNASGGAVPGHSTVYDYRTFGPTNSSTLQFNVDYVVTAPGSGAHDTFGFAFQNAALTNLFSVNFVLTTGIGNNPVNSTTADDVSITSNGANNGAAAAPVASFTLGSRYHLTVNVNVTAGTFSAFLTPQNNTGGNNGTTVTLATNVAFAGTISDVAATWNLATTTTSPATTAGGANATAYTGAGTNGLIFDNYLVTIPEPSTYALLGVGVVALGLGLRRRQAA